MTTTPSKEAREAATQFFGDAENHPTVVRALELLITKVQLEERERCAALLDDTTVINRAVPSLGGKQDGFAHTIRRACQAAIRQQEREQ